VIAESIENIKGCMLSIDAEFVELWMLSIDAETVEIFSHRFLFRNGKVD
jgi:hypothetical protein